MKVFIFVFLFVMVNPLFAQGRKCGIVRPLAYRTGTYSTGELAGRTIGDLYAGYIGVRHIPKQVTADPARQLDSLWRVKESCYKEAAIVRSLHAELLASYKKEKTAKTLAQFVAVADNAIGVVKNDMDWEKFSRLYRLDGRQMSVLKMLASRLNGRDFVAYGMTEIMPSADGLLNLQVLEFLTRNYGPEFVYRIPAVNDRYASFGFFQFTSLALDGRTSVGASRASKALMRNPLPSSVQDVQGELQFRAAYLFAIHNIASTLRTLSSKELTVLAKLGSKNHDDLIQFIAAAHNGPAHARSATHRWLGTEMKYDFFISVKNDNVRKYAYKTKMNLLALRSHKNLSGILYGAR